MTAMAPNETHSEAANKFHWLFLPGQRKETPLYDTKVDESQHFVVLPTKGSIVAGWVLVVPKFPVPRMADVPRDMLDELHELVKRVCKKIDSQFGRSYAFEHGGLKGSTVSCGVDQAHLHIAPLDFDLITAAQEKSPGGWTHEASQLPRESFVNTEYWFASSGDNAVCKSIDKPCSQFFRRIIAENVGLADSWDYKANDFIENVYTTVRAMSVNG
ncbi:HIT domain-containing protein [Limibacillus sp. MBR-115]|jgi:diadenosine tetraphosphate (Ap4A) HIT family hydrolase|uniref:HIT family protein n=1 Tax=Limibacillus sp. MBR-115 TaxID=3156465 RepID=UPI003397CC97